MRVDSEIKIHKEGDGTLIVERNGKRAALNYQEVFGLGHSLFLAHKYHAAQDVFAQLSKIRGHGPRAKVMLARCKAELESFEACRDLLQSIFDGDQEQIAEDLQGAFVFHTIGLNDDAIRELVKVIKNYPDFPTALLYLGDLYLEKGNREKAEFCWKLAVKRDRKGGAVALAARKQLARLKKTKLRKKAKKKVTRPNSK